MKRLYATLLARVNQNTCCDRMQTRAERTSAIISAVTRETRCTGT
jgi:hypothetical protein